MRAGAFLPTTAARSIAGRVAWRAAWLATWLAAAPRAVYAAPEAPASARVAPAATAAELAARLRAHQVSTDDFARSVFYTWTTPVQIEALRSSRTLLVATAQSTGRPSPFLRLLQEIKDKDSPNDGRELAALLLDHPQLQRRRYAWTSPFATVLGLGERTYGEALIEVVLRPESIIGRVMRPAQRAKRQSSPSTSPNLPSSAFTFVDLHGNPVAASEVLAHPERLAAIFHVRPPSPQEPSDFVPFREYILCNEAMVKAWSVGTPAIRERLLAETSLLQALRSHFAALPRAESATSAVAAWSGVAAAAPLAAQWRAALAFDNRRYRPLPGNLEQIAAGLTRYDSTQPPISYQAAR